MEDARELMPEIVGDDSVGIEYAINGLLDHPDAQPILGETPEVNGLWSAAAVWVKEGPGVGRAMAEWIVHGEPEIDLQSSDVARFYDCQKTTEHVRGAPRRASTRPTASSTPASSGSRTVPSVVAVLRARAELRAVFFEAAGWERPHWYESNRPLLERYADQISDRPVEWDSRWWSPIINAEHLAMRDGVAMFDLTAFCVFDVVGPGALDSVQRVAMRQMDVNVGRVVYTPILTPGGGFRADLTIMRLDDEHFRVVTGGASGMADLKWFGDHLAEGTAQIFDLTSGWCIGLWGPRARDVLGSVTSDDVSHEGFPFASCRTIEVDSLRVLASRISYVGDRGWELHVPIDQGAKLWDVMKPAGRTRSCRPGSRVRHNRSAGEVLPRVWVRARRRLQRRRGGHGVGKVKAQDFVGKEAHVRHREEEPAAVMCTLTVDDHTAGNGQLRYMLGDEPI